MVGHSSGEIAAAAVAGLITSEDAIKIAYYRGQAPKKFSSDVPVGMLAAGISAEEVGKYLESSEGKVQIACYNSPTSLTLAGPTSELEKVKDLLEKDNFFARMLLVNLAYHSSYMADIGDEYEICLKNCIPAPRVDKASKDAKAISVKMFSSVTGRLMVNSTDVVYWKSNMLSPVRFAQAATELLQDTEAPNFLIEIGPSNALSGPIAQIKKSLTGVASDAQYTAALKRGTDAIIPLFELAGRMFLSGGSPNLGQVNQAKSTQSPAFIVDLPNYSWNHSTKYWHETTASRDWRFKKFMIHDLLGSKINGIPWGSPIFKKVLKLADVSWLRDHKLGSQVVFPGAGYIAMAIEAVYQASFMTIWKQEVPARFRYKLRDVRFSRAIVLEEDTESRIMLSLTPVPGSTRSWFQFKVYSSRDNSWTEHSTGLVRVETDYKDNTALPTAIEPLKYPTPSRSWYKALADAGYNFGTSFQKHLMIESTTGKRESRSILSMEAPLSSYTQSFYPMHPVCIDGCFQSVTPALWQGDRTTLSTVLVPSVIGSLVITGREQQPENAVSVASAQFMGIGRTDTPRNYGTNCSVYDPTDGALLLEMKGLQFAELETSEDEGPVHTFTRLSWDADISTLLSAPDPKLQHFLGERYRSGLLENSEKSQQETLVQDLVDLIAHKNPTLKIAEINLDPKDTTNFWLQGGGPKRAASSLYHFASSDPLTLASPQKTDLSTASNEESSLFDLSKAEAILADVKFDLILVKVPQSVSEEDMKVAVDSFCKSVQDRGLVLVVGPNDSGSISTIEATIGKIGVVHPLDENIYICQAGLPPIVPEDIERTTISHVSLFESQLASSELVESLRNSKWDIKSAQPLSEIEVNQTVLILDELSSSVMDRLEEEQWKILQSLIQKECKILWVTTGAQLDVTEPTKAAINGFFRVLRAEEPLLNLITLDVEHSSGPANATAVEACLRLINQSKPKQQADSEFVERKGILHVSRVLPEKDLTNSQSDEMSSLKTEVVDLHACKTPIRLRTERIANIDSIHYGEISPVPLPLQDGCIEVQLYAAGMNYKDVVVTMGIVPGDEHSLGGEGAGIGELFSSNVQPL